jgi:hypothetical protein
MWQENAEKKKKVVVVVVVKSLDTLFSRIPDFRSL